MPVKIMEDFIDNSEEYLDDFYIQNTKSGSGKAAKKYSSNPKAADNNTASLIKKFEPLPISKKYKQSLLSLVMNHKISDISKLVKVNEKSATFHGEAYWKKIGSYIDVIIKVYSNSCGNNDKLFAYSRRISKDGKPMEADTTNPNYHKKHIVLYKNDNTVIMKMFKGCKSIEQMIKSYPNKKHQFFTELLELFINVRQRDWCLWQNNACTSKNILWHNGKWIFLSTNCGYEYCYHGDLIYENLLNIINLFKSYGVSNAELKRRLQEQTGKSCNHIFPYNFYRNDFFATHLPVE
jgi:hypothetical protein